MIYFPIVQFAIHRQRMSEFCIRYYTAIELSFLKLFCQTYVIATKAKVSHTFEESYIKHMSGSNH